MLLPFVPHSRENWVNKIDIIDLILDQLPQFLSTQLTFEQKLM